MRLLRRSVIWGAGIAAAATLTLAAWRLVEEEICLRRLDSSDEAERESAAGRLARLKSSRAVPKLVPLALALPPGAARGQSYAGDALLAIGGASVPSLLDQIDGSSSPREGTARALLERFGREAVDALVAGARGHDRKEVRCFSLHALGRHVNEEPRVYKVLLKALEDPEWEVRLAAVTPLVKVRGREAEVLKLLTTVLEDACEEQVVRYWAAFDMPALGLPARAALRDALKHGDPLVRVYAAHSLQYQWPDLEQETAPVLLEGLQATDWRARYQAVDSLSRLDSQSNTKRLTAQVLKKLLEDPVDDVRSAAVTALGDHEPSEEMVAPLIGVLVEQPDAGPSVADVLARLGHRAGPAVPALADWLAKDVDDPRRSSVARALGRVGPAAAPSVPALAAELKRGCCAALEALGRIGEGALEATPAILEALSGSDCRYEVRPALARIGPRAFPHLLEALRGSETEVRRIIIQILGDFGPSAGAAAGDLVALVEGEDSETKLEAVRTLGRIGPGAAPHVDLILGILAANLSDPGDLAAVAAEALGRIGMPDGKSAQRLVDAARSSYHEVRAHAMLALGRLKRGDPETIALLRGGLADEELLVRSFSAMGLHDLGFDDDSIAKALPAAFAGVGFLRFVRALEGFPGETKRVLSWLLESLNTDSPEYSIGVINLIEGLGPDAKAALPALLELAGKARAESAHQVGISISFDPTVKHYSTEDLLDAIEDLRRRLEGEERG